MRQYAINLNYTILICKALFIVQVALWLNLCQREQIFVCLMLFFLIVPEAECRQQDLLSTAVMYDIII